MQEFCREGEIKKGYENIEIGVVDQVVTKNLLRSVMGFSGEVEVYRKFNRSSFVLNL